MVLNIYNLSLHLNAPFYLVSRKMDYYMSVSFWEQIRGQDM